MRYHKGIRKMGRVGVFLASVSSILVLAGPASAAEASPGHRPGYAQFFVYLTGDELRDGGDRDGRGIAQLQFDPVEETVCYVTTWRRLDGAVTDFQLRAAPRRNDGPRWIDLFSDRYFDGERDTVSGCVYSPRGKILDVIENPSDFYLKINTTVREREEGAIRGQLG
ncbi:MAG: CHRD domain-containing protein [Pseudonocardiaceae bacterium]